VRPRCFWLLARDTEDADALSFVASDLSLFRQRLRLGFVTHTRYKLFTAENFPKTKDDSYNKLNNSDIWIFRGIFLRRVYRLRD